MRIRGTGFEKYKVEPEDRYGPSVPFTVTGPKKQWAMQPTNKKDIFFSIPADVSGPTGWGIRGKERFRKEGDEFIPL